MVNMIILFGIGYFVLYMSSWWNIFTKANYAGWKSLIPFYNFYIMLKIVDLSFLYIFLWIIPIINLAAVAYYYYKLASYFGRGVWFTLGLIFLNPIFIIILGMGSAKYLGRMNEN